MRVLLVCSSTDGHTRGICEHVRGLLTDAGDAVTLVMIEDARELSPAGFEMAVIGARIRYGRTDARVIAYANRYAATLNAMPSAFFSVNLTARKAGKDRPDTNPYVRAFLRRVAWRPRLLAVFAGSLDYPRYGALDRWIIRVIMWMTGGPTRADAVVVYTDWDRVDEFASSLASRALQIDSGTISIAPHGHSATHMPQPLQ